ncbi:uncharacterized protein LOC144348053 isoform X2 [Saccoglossus kowalevskii]
MECPVEPESCQCMEPTTGRQTVQVTTPTRVRLYDTSLKSPLYTDHNIPPQSEYPIEITSQDPVTTETSNIIGPPIGKASTHFFQWRQSLLFVFCM